MAEPSLDWFSRVPALVSEPAETEATIGAFIKHFGAERIQQMPQVNASEDVGVFGEVLQVPTVFRRRSLVIAALAWLDKP